MGTQYCNSAYSVHSRPTTSTTTACMKRHPRVRAIALAIAVTALPLLPLLSYLMHSRTAKDLNLKYIYQHDHKRTHPFLYMGRGQSVFIENKCTYWNCFVTPQRHLLGDERLFDAVLFHAPEIKDVTQLERSVTQKFVFMSTESSHYYPLNSMAWDSFFNWTWTYRLDSDVPWLYVTVRDETGRVVAPAREVTWRPHFDMAPVPDTLRAFLKNKRFAAAWLVSNCNAISKRKEFVNELQQELTKFGLTVEVRGKCSRRAQKDTDSFLREVEQDYYFYLALENSFSEDYVTEKLLHATRHFAVPVLWGGANYTRFLPPHSYLDGRALGAIGTAAIMRHLIANPEQYAEYHRWRSHYSYHGPQSSSETNTFCRLCEMLNSDEYRRTTIYQDMRAWWNH